MPTIREYFFLDPIESEVAELNESLMDPNRDYVLDEQGNPVPLQDTDILSDMSPKSRVQEILDATPDMAAKNEERERLLLENPWLYPKYRALQDKLNRRGESAELSEAVLDDFWTSESTRQLPQTESVEPRTFEKLGMAYRKNVESTNLDVLYYMASTLGGKVPGVLTMDEVQKIENEFIERWQDNPIEAKGWLEAVLIPSTSFLASMVEGGKKGVTTAAMAAGTAAAAGMTLGAPFPEELVTVPAAASMGYAAGTMTHWAIQGAGSVIRDLTRRGVDNNIAAFIGTIAGVPYALIERLQIAKFLPKTAQKEMNQIVTESLSKTIGKMLVRHGEDWATQIGQEELQDITLGLSEELSVFVDNLVNDGDIDYKTAEEWKAQLLETFKQTALGVLPMRGGVAVIETPGAIRGTKKLQEVAGALHEAKKVFEQFDEAVEKGEETPLGELKKIAEEITSDEANDINISFAEEDLVVEFTESKFEEITGYKPELNQFEKVGEENGEAIYRARVRGQNDTESGVTLSESADRSTVLEEIVEYRLKTLARDKAEVATKIRVWANAVRKTAEAEGIALRYSDTDNGNIELFSDAMVYHYGGFGSLNPYAAVVSYIPSELADEFIGELGVMSDGTQLWDVLRGKDERAVTTEKFREGVKSKMDMPSEKESRAPPEAGETFKLATARHYSTEYGLNVISPEHINEESGNSDANRVARDGAPKRIYFYLGEQGEPHITTGANVLYQSIIETDDYYNLIEDEQGLWEKHNNNLTDIENDIKSQGYKGHIGDLDGDERFRVLASYEDVPVAKFNILHHNTKKIAENTNLPKNVSDTINVLNDLELALEKLFKDNPSPSGSEIVDAIAGVRRWSDKRSKDLVDYNVLVKALNKQLKENPDSGKWYDEMADLVKEVVGTDNIVEFAGIFGPTSAQASPEVNFANTLFVMRMARKHNPITHTDEFIEALKSEPLITDNSQVYKFLEPKKIQKIVNWYIHKEFAQEDSFKTPIYAQTLLHRAYNEYFPFSVHDTWMSKLFGLNVRPSDVEYRIMNYTVSRLARDFNLRTDVVQALLWNSVRVAGKTPGNAESIRQLVAGEIDAFKALPKQSFMRPDPRSAKIIAFKGEPKVEKHEFAMTPEILGSLREHAVSVAPATPIEPFTTAPEGASQTKINGIRKAVANVLFDETPTGLKLKLAQALNIPNHVEPSTGTWNGELNQNFIISFPGASFEQVQYISALLSDAVYQEGSFVYQVVDGSPNAFIVEKTDGSAFSGQEQIDLSSDVDNDLTALPGGKGLLFFTEGNFNSLKYALENTAILDILINEATTHGEFKKDYKETIKQGKAASQESLGAASWANDNIYAPIYDIVRRNPDFFGGQEGKPPGRRDPRTYQLTPPTTPEFKKWFGDSKVVDEDGKPLVVYHGTTRDFDIFQPKDSFRFQAGFATPRETSVSFFTSNPQVAEDFATSRLITDLDKKDIQEIPRRLRAYAFAIDLRGIPRDDLGDIGGKTIYPVYLSIKNPLDVRTMTAEKEKIIESIFGTRLDIFFPTDENPAWFLPDGSFDNDAYYEHVANRFWFLLDNNKVIEQIKEAGYDGVFLSEKMPETGLSPSVEFTSFVPLSNTQIKSATGNLGTFDPADANITHQLAPTFYSHTKRVVADKFPASMNALSVKNWLRKNQAKPEEIEWLDLESFLKGKKKVTREELQDWIAAHEIVVEEKMLKESSILTIKNAIEQINRGNTDIAAVTDGGMYFIKTIDDVTSWSSVDGFKYFVNRETYDESDVQVVFHVVNDVTNYNYGTYASRAAAEGRRDNVISIGDVRYGISVVETDEPIGDRNVQHEERVLPGGSNYRELLLKLPIEGAPFDSPHFAGAKNILAHIRFNTRYDSEGNKVLFIEEIQSDWHQEGAREGYSKKVEKITEIPENYEIKQILLINGEYEWQAKQLSTGYNVPFRARAFTKEEAESEVLWWLNAKEERRAEGIVPNAPFKGDGWLHLSLKRMLRYAAENDFDKLSWTTGAQQVERYETATRAKVDKIHWQRKIPQNEKALAGRQKELLKKETLNVVEREELIKINEIIEFHGEPHIIVNGIKGDRSVGTFTVPVNGTTNINGKDVSLDTLLGKSMASKIRESNERTGVLEGADLTIGGEGMKMWYDKKLPTFLKKYGKRWGVQVGTSSIDLTVTGDLVNIPQSPVTNPSIDITPSMKHDVMQGQPTFQLDSLTEETWRDWFITKVVDSMRPLQMLQEDLSQKELPDNLNAYMASELFIGRADTRLKNFKKKIYDVDKKDSFVRRLENAGIPIEDFADYLYSKHAPERNAHIEKTNGMENGSGISTEEANSRVETHRKKHGKKLEKYEKEFRREVIDKGLKARLRAGLIDKDTFSRLSEHYEFYVPLFRVMDTEETLTTNLGEGFSVGGKEFKRAKGSERDVLNVFINAVSQHEEGIVRAEKNKVGQTLIKLIEKFPSSEITVRGIKHVPRYNAEGEIEFFAPTEGAPLKNQMDVKVGGKVQRIEFKGKRGEKVAAAMRNLGAGRAIPGLIHFNAYLRAVATTFNPEFLVTNLMRDLQTAGIHIGGELGSKTLRKALNPVNIGRAMGGIYRNVRDKEASEWAELYEELKLSGGRVGWFDSKTIEEKVEKLRKDLGRVEDKGLGAAKAGRTIGEFVNNMNEAVESAVRLTVYKTLRDNGVSKSKAAHASKNITVNFNRKGELGSVINSLWLFSNATIQGSYRIATSIGKSKKTRAIVSGIIMAGFFESIFNLMADDDEYEKMNDWEKDNNWVIMRPNGEYFKVRVPYGYNIFKTMGNLAAQAWWDMDKTGEVDWLHYAGRGISAVDNAFNPFGTGSPSEIVVPTAARWLVQLSKNENYASAPIKPENVYPPYKSEVELKFKNVRPMSEAAADKLFTATGGEIRRDEEGNIIEAIRDDYTIDVSPETIDYIIDYFGAGTGKFITNIINAGKGAMKKEKPHPTNVPFLRLVYGVPNEYSEIRLLNQYRREMGRKIFSSVEIDKFKRYLGDALERGTIDRDDYDKRFKEFEKNQNKLKGIEPKKRVKFKRRRKIGG